jgi:hypothetical protein
MEVFMKAVYLILVSMVLSGCSHYVIVQDNYGPKSWDKAHNVATIFEDYNFNNANERVIVIEDEIGNKINFIRNDENSLAVIYKGKVGGQFSHSYIMNIINRKREFISDYMENYK